MYYDRSASHFVLFRDDSGFDESYNKVSTFRANLQPATGETTALINGAYGKTYSLFTTYSGLQVEDIVTLSGTTTLSGMRYNVKAVKEYNYGPLPHFEAVVVNPEE